MNEEIQNKCDGSGNFTLFEPKCGGCENCFEYRVKKAVLAERKRCAEIIEKEGKDWLSCGCDETLKTIATALEKGEEV